MAQPRFPRAKMNPVAREWLDAGLSFLFPSVCQLCSAARATPAEGYVCPTCWQNLRFISVLAPVAYKSDHKPPLPIRLATT